ncbi:MAG: TonB-dependent receptor [Opitutaceae bacterium]
MKHTVSILAATALAASLHADETAPLQELESTTIVTGSLWNSELQNTTASVSVISEETLKASGSQHFGDIISTIPNLSWSAGSSRPRYIQIRGIGENSQFEGETPDSAVRFLVDDLDFTGIGTIGNLFDVQQVEVLRGPQAGAFGANAAGGIIKLVTNDPTPYWTGQVEGSLGNDSLMSGGLAIGGPLLEGNPEALTFRFSLHQLLQDGFRDNKFLGKSDTNERDELSTRLKLRWLPSSDWQFDGTLFFADADNGYDEWSLGNTGFDVFSDEPGRDEQESFATSIRGKWTGLDKVDVTTVTSFTNTDSLTSFDGDWTNPIDTPATYIGFLATERERQRWSEEVRFDSADEEDALGFIDRWTTGIYFEDFEESTIFTYSDPSGAYPFDTNLESQTLSFYGQGTHLLGDKTRLTLGLRAEYYDMESTVDFSDPGLMDNPDFDDWLFGGKLTLEHDLTNTSTLFASITKGYKAGGANIYPELELAVPTSYDTENLWNYEMGSQVDWLEGAVVSKITLFYLDRDDTQVRSSTGQGIDFTYATSNAGDAEHYGAEFESTWFLNDNWSITAGLGLLETELDSTGDDLSGAPAYTYNARIDYAAQSGFFFNLEVVGSDEYYESNNSVDRDQRTRSKFAVVNGAIGYSHENWTLTFWGRNLFDEDYEKRVFYFGNEGPGYADTRYENPADPQQFGATLNYAW